MDDRLVEAARDSDGLDLGSRSGVRARLNFDLDHRQRHQQGLKKTDLPGTLGPGLCMRAEVER